MTEPNLNNPAELAAVLYEVAGKLAHRFIFSYHDLEDIKHQAILEVLKAMPRYDKSRPFRPFAYSHMRNRLKNFIRDSHVNLLPPPKSVAGLQKEQLDHYIQVNKMRHSLANPADISASYDGKTGVESKAHEEVCFAEFVDLIERSLDQETLAWFQEVRGGGTIDRSNYKHLRRAVRRIMNVSA